MVLGDDQYYYISLCEDLESIRLIMTPDEDGNITENGLKERRELVEYFYETLVSVVKSLSKSSEDIHLPTAYVVCPQCDELHFTLDLVLGAKKRALRCKTKLPLGYYSDLAKEGA